MSEHLTYSTLPAAPTLPLPPAEIPADTSQSDEVFTILAELEATADKTRQREDEAADYHRLVLSRARYYLTGLPHEDAEDAAQEALLQFYQRRASDEVFENPEAMLRTIAARRSVDAIRKVARFRARFSSSDIDLDTLPGRTDTDDLASQFKALCELVERLLGQQARDYLELRAEGLDHTAACDVLGISRHAGYAILAEVRELAKDNLDFPGAH